MIGNCLDVLTLTGDKNMTVERIHTKYKSGDGAGATLRTTKQENGEYIIETFLPPGLQMHPDFPEWRDVEANHHHARNIWGVHNMRLKKLGFKRQS